MKNILLYLLLLIPTIIYSQETFEFNSNRLYVYKSKKLISSIKTKNIIRFNSTSIIINNKHYANYMVVGEKNEDILIVAFNISNDKSKSEEWVIVTGEDGKKAIVVFRAGLTYMYWYEPEKIKRT